MLSKFLYRAAMVAALVFLTACGGGDDDGRRLGEMIVGTWQRGWGEGDVVIDGDTDLGTITLRTISLFFVVMAITTAWCAKVLLPPTTQKVW